MLKINRQTDYAVRVILALAQQGEGARLSSGEIQKAMLIPADRKWVRNAAIAAIVKETLEEMDPRYPKVSWKPGDFTLATMPPKTPM